MEQFKWMEKKIIFQRMNSIFISIICELFLPIMLLLFIIIFKSIVSNEIIYADKYNENPVTVGPFCFMCNLEALINHEPTLLFPQAKQIGIELNNHPSKFCQIFNDSIIAIIEDFTSAKDIQDVIQMFTGINQEYNPTNSSGNFSFKYKSFNSESEFENYRNNPLYKTKSDISQSYDGVCVGIQIRKYSDVYYITLRLSDDYFWKDFFQQSNIKLEPSTLLQSNEINNYIKANFTFQQFTQGGFMTLQSVIMDLIIASFSHRYKRLVSQIYLSPLHNPKIIKEFIFIKKIKTFIQILIGIGFFPIFFRVSKTIGNEKESRIICLMYMKGIKRKYYWLSWIIEYLIASLILSVLCTFLTKFGFMINTNFFLILVFYFLHSMNEFSFSLFFSSFLNTSIITIIVGGSFYFVSMLLGVMINTYDFDFSVIQWASLIPPIGGISFISILSDFEYDRSNQILGQFQEAQYLFKLILLIIIQLYTCLFFSILGIILNLLLNNSVNLPKYFHSSNYICETSNNNQTQDRKEFKLEIPHFIFNAPKNSLNNLNIHNNEFEKENLFEEKKVETKEIQNFIDNNDRELKNLKIFDIKTMKENYKLESKSNQLHDANIKLDEGDILVLIGKNGSGKSTFLNLISKLINKTNKNLNKQSLINLESIEKDLEKNKYAICLNDDIFFPDFTLEENLIIFDLIAGKNPEITASQFFSEFVSKDNIADLYKLSPDDLSTGMRRLLSLSIAYSGNPGIILLDNPTIGMDISLRREIHKKIQENSKSKITILATQNMEEAEFLGTKFVIIDNGRFLLYDSLLSFKEGWHTHYTLTIEHKLQLYHNQNQNNHNNNNNAANINEISLDREKTLDDIKKTQIEITEFIKVNLINKKELIKPLIKKRIPEITEESKKEEENNKILNLFYSAKVIKFGLSLNKLKPEKFLNFFDGLKGKLNKSNLNYFSFSKQSIEDVLIQLFPDNNLLNVNSYLRENTSQTNDVSQNCCGRFCQNFFGFFRKYFGLFLWKRIWDIIYSEYFPCIFFTMLLMIIINCFTITVNFKYKQQIPKITYNFPSENLPFYYQIADPKYLLKNNEYINLVYSKFDEYIVKLPNKKIIQKDYNSVALSDSIKDFHHFIYNQSKVSSTYIFDSLQIWRLMTRETDISSYSFSTLISYLNISNPLFIGLTTSHIINILQQAITDGKYNIVFTNYPMPASSYTQKMMRLKLSLIPISFYIFSLSLINFIIVNSIIKERKQGSYFMIKLYKKSFYWLYNFLFHICESLIITTLFIIFLVNWFKFTIDNIWGLSLIHSISIITFYYCCIILWKISIFRRVSAESILLINIVIGNIISPLFQVLTRFDEIKFPLAILEKIIQFIFPTFALHHGLFYSLFKQSKAYYPEDTNYTQIENNIKFSMFGMSSSLILYIIILILFEAMNIVKTKHSKIFGEISSTILGTNRRRNYNPPNHINTNLDIDSDRNENNMTSRMMNQFPAPDNSHSDSQLIKEIRLPFLYKSCYKHILRSSDIDNIAFAQYLKIVKEKFCNNSELLNHNENDEIGFCTENGCAILNLTVRINLEFYLLLKGNYEYNSEVVQKADDLMTQLNIYYLRDTLASNLSDGQKKLLSIAISIIGNPSLLLIENLSSKLDPFARINLWNLFSYHNKFNKIPLILLSYNLEESITLSNSFLHLSNNILKHQSFNQLISPEDIMFDNMKFYIPFLTDDQLIEFLNQLQELQFIVISPNDAFENINKIYNKFGISNSSINISPNEIVEKIKKINPITLDLNDYYRIFVPLKSGFEFLDKCKNLFKNIEITFSKDKFHFLAKFNYKILQINEIHYKFYILNLQKQIDLVTYGQTLDSIINNELLLILEN